MSFSDWQKNGWLRPHQTSPAEIENLLAVIERDLTASNNTATDSDWRFAIAYNAALQCAALALYASGFEAPKGGGAHHRTIDSLRLTIQPDEFLITALQAFRSKRGGGIYEATGIASTAEIDQLCALARSLREQMLKWLKAAHPHLLPPKPPRAKRR
ncbi:MAG TPA: hypothetical protein VHQ47_19080 [Phycisphaerae bacterium]|jgi:hypothetical protein|nr:hypothetical protein [Phycisphaerae bacterium]